MLFRIKVISPASEKLQRLYLVEMDAGSGKEVLAEVYRGRQAVGNGSKTEIRAGDDDRFFGVEAKNDILGWVDERIKKGR